MKNSRICFGNGSLTARFDIATDESVEMDVANRGKSLLRDAYLSNEELRLHVSNLMYKPAKTVPGMMNEAIVSRFPYWEFPAWQRMTTNYMKSADGNDNKETSSVAPLANVTFSAKVSKITAIVSTTYGERRSIIDLISGRRKRGTYDGEIYLGGGHVDCTSTLAMNTAFVPRKSLYIPGFTYLQLLRYAAQQRMTVNPNGTRRNVSSEEIESRVHDVLRLMDLYQIRNRELPDDPPRRGVEAGDLRRLSIAVEVVALPPLVVIDDPTVRLEPAVAAVIMTSLRRLAERGCVVVLAMPAPSPQILACIDKLVLVGRGGFTIYAAPPQDLKTYFCSSSVGYVYDGKHQTDLMGWVLEIANGVERPQDARESVNMYMVQEIFQSSPFFTCNGDIPTDEKHIVSAFDEVEAHSNTLGYFKGQLAVSVVMYRIFVAITRAFHAKILERDILRKSIVSSILVGAWMGYLEYGVGQYGYDTMNLIKVPYVNTSNITALLFFIPAFIFTQQVLNVQLICRKVSVYRQEQQSGYCGAAAFGIATFLSEVPFQAFYAVLFGCVVYFLSELHLGWFNFLFYCKIMASTAMLGVMTAFSYAVLFRAEVAVRDLFLFTVFSMMLLSGFPFQLPSINPNMKHLSTINPTRWMYEALMAWKFNSGSYHDGADYLAGFGFSTYEPSAMFHYWRTFYIVNGIVTALLLLDTPQLLVRKFRKKRAGLYGRASDQSSDVNDRLSGRPSSLDAGEKDAWVSDAAAENLLGSSDHGSNPLNSNVRRGDLDPHSAGGSFSQIMSGSFSEGAGAAGAASAAISAVTSGGGGSSSGSGSGFDVSSFPRMKTSELASPALFFRESSVSGSLTHRSSLRSQKSLSGDSGDDRGSRGAGTGLPPIYSPYRKAGGGPMDEADLINQRGPNVSFANVSYKERNRERISGYDNVLSDVSGEFQWGKLGCIMGAPQCGKTTLLHVLAGSTAFRSNVEGTVLYDNMRGDPNVPLWRRCALVEQDDRHLPDLTVLESITYAMSLRRGVYGGQGDSEGSSSRSGRSRGASSAYASSANRFGKARDSMGNLQQAGGGGGDFGFDNTNDNADGFITQQSGSDLAENVKYALASLYLTAIGDKRVKDLTPGERRRLSIAEECVIFPSLLLIDEPCTALGLLDESVLLRAFREMVNNDKTVVCTLHQPSQQAFALFDTLLLLSAGRVVYHGPVDGAMEHFTSSPCSFSFDREVYSNSAEWLVDISGGYIPNTRGKFVSREALVECYRAGKLFQDLMSRLSELYHSVAPLWEGYSDKDSDVATSPLRSKRALSLGTRSAVHSKERSLDQDNSSEKRDSELAPDAAFEDEGEEEGVRQDEEGMLDRPQPMEDLRKDGSTKESDYLTRCIRGTSTLVEVGVEALSHGSNDFCLFFTHPTIRRQACQNAYTLLARSCWSLWRRQVLFWGIIVTQMLIALVLAVILGDASGSQYNIISFFAVSALLLMLSSVQLISYLFECNQQFLKEHSRGMYSAFLYWLVTPLPLYALRAVGAMFFSLITYKLLNLEDNSDIRLYYYVTTVVLVMCSTMLGEVVIYAVSSLRAAYLIIPAVSFVQFQFSGLMLKPCLMPAGISNVGPSISILRWVLQGQVVNYFNDSPLFPDLPGYSTYLHFISLYGWGGKSKWYCLYTIFLIMALFKLLTLGSLVIRSRIAKGGRGRV